MVNTDFEPSTGIPGIRDHINFEWTVNNLTDIIEYALGQGRTVRDIAEELVACGYVEPEEPRRIWMYRDGWTGPLFMLGGDEFGNRPLVIRLPRERALLVNLAPRLKRRYDDGTGDD